MKVDAEQTRIMLRDIEARNEANEAERVRVAKLNAEGGAEFDRLQMMGQRMATTMMAHAQRRAADHAALLFEQQRQQAEESKRLAAEAQVLETYRAELQKSAKRIEEGSAYLVQITVPEAPLPVQPGRAAGHERPQAATPWTGGPPGPG
jgi:membrane protease subunit (stomatin/prohibitin family)